MKNQYDNMKTLQGYYPHSYGIDLQGNLLADREERRWYQDEQCWNCDRPGADKGRGKTLAWLKRIIRVRRRMARLQRGGIAYGLHSQQ